MIEEISTNETINISTISGATINETIDITTIETSPTAAHRQQHHQQKERSIPILAISDDSDDIVIIETDTKQPQQHQHHHRHRHHHNHHKHSTEKQPAPQPPVPPPLPTSTPPYLTPTEEVTQVAWVTDLDLPAQQPSQEPTNLRSVPVQQSISQSLPAASSSIPAIAQSSQQSASATETAVSAELIIETQQQQPAPSVLPVQPETTELVLVGMVSSDATDKHKKSYRVSTDMTESPQQPKKCCGCTIA